MKLLIIGSKGFIGTHLVNYFKVLPDFSVCESDVMVDYANKNYYLIDATNSNYQEILRAEYFDVCINCSGAASVPDSLQNPMRDFTLNTLNVFKLLDAIRIFQPKCKFINLSSAAVYGNPVSIPIHEASVCAPVSPYGIHKMQAEQICREFFSYYEVPTCSLRIFSAYGNGLKKQLFWDLYQKAKSSDKVELFGTGTETRDFIHVDDVCRAIHCCVNSSKFEGEAINVANGEEISIRQAVELFYDLFEQSKTVHFNQQGKRGDPLNWKADVTCLKNMGYKKTIELNKGLQRYFLWISQL